MQEHYRREVVSTGGRSGPVYSYDKNGVFMRPPEVDGARKKFALKSLQARILFFEHYTLLNLHWGDRALYNTL